MNELVRVLFNLETLQWGAEGVELGFERPIPAWAWGGIIGAALLAALWSYWRLTGARWGRAALALLRAALIVLLVLLISGPQLVQRSESVERDWVLVLVDRSASMSIADAPGPAGALVPREEQLRRALIDHAPMWRSLSDERIVQWLGFDAGAFDLPVGERGVPVLAEPDGRRTLIGPALDQALARAAARPLAAVVLFSDGRTTSEPTRAALRRLQSERVPVHTVPLGSGTPIADIALRRIDAPRMAFVNDTTPVRVEVERLGGDAGLAAATVSLIDKATGLTLDSERIVWEGESSTAVLSGRPEEAGARSWLVRIDPEGPDLIPGNNSGEFTIELVDRPMRVLYIDGYPRWEQRYLRNLLIRERSITASTLILSPDRRYIQEGDVEIDALPDSPGAWAEYDAVIIGDVNPDVFTADQLALLREHVARRGGGLLWIGGPGSVPSQWWATPLADLIPFTKEAGDGSPIGEPVLMRPTATAERLGLMRLGEPGESPWPDELADPAAGWSSLRWAQRLAPDRLKPATEVLGESDPGGWPIVMSMRFGAGRSLYVATDEVWRWRYGRGEVLPERFWLQMIRLLGRESLARSGRAAVLSITPRRSDVDQPVRVSVELLDQMLAEMRLPSIQVRLTRRAAPTPGSDPEGGQSSAELILRPEREDGRTYAAIWLPPEPGVWVGEPMDSALAGMGLSAEVAVLLPDDELRRPETDHPLLAGLSEETGGAVLTVDRLGTLPERIPNRKIRLLHEVTESLWDTPFALLMVLMLATLEWVGRRVIRLI